MKEILSTCKQTILVDNEDYLLLNRHTWFIENGYAVAWFNGNRIKMQNLVIYRPSGKVIDHRDRNKLNNQKENLRLVSYSQNSMNRSMMVNNETGYIGVRAKTSKEGKSFYMSAIYVNDKDRYIAQGQNLQELAELRDYVAWKLRGEYAVLNFPDNDYSKFNHPKKDSLDKKLLRW